MTPPDPKPFSRSPERLSPPPDHVDRALLALQQVEVPEGLQQRVLQAVAQRTATRRNTGSWHSRVPFVAWGFAAVFGLLLATVFTTDLRHRRVPGFATRTAPSAPADTRAPASPPAPQTTAEQTQPGQVRLTRRPVAHTRSALLIAHFTPGQSERVAEEFDHPAPELPLTSQERLLVRMAYGAQPQQQMARLHRDGMRLRPPADDDFDFNSFFDPYITPLNEGDPK